MYTYVFAPSALKELKKLSTDIRKRIITKLDYFTSSENPLLFADALVNHDIGSYRFRVGDYRIIFDREDEVIVVLAVGHRRDIYK